MFILFKWMMFDFHGGFPGCKIWYGLDLPPIGLPKILKMYCHPGDNFYWNPGARGVDLRYMVWEKDEVFRLPAVDFNESSRLFLETSSSNLVPKAASFPEKKNSVNPFFSPNRHEL